MPYIVNKQLKKHSDAVSFYTTWVKWISQKIIISYQGVEGKEGGSKNSSNVFNYNNNVQDDFFNLPVFY